MLTSACAYGVLAYYGVHPTYVGKQRKVNAMAKPNKTPTPPAPAAPQAAPPAAATANAAPVNAALSVVYKAGKAYNVRAGTAQDNSRSWAAIQAVLQQAGGQASRAAIVAAVTPFNHAPFVGYAIRRGWLVPAGAVPSTAP